ncbi:hypothetical protein FOZ61_009233 [Perkinsus olseni]|uniref:phosphatidylserine decarboxylase n=1 Tax=Perkinsus olseni TaxID=32597 RepID=A0A7J6M5V1_PEROL|nr:hypothetical protein FOZ61_009233 [Perkinsus olseni]KAF4671882.1 hypothetical protein FOL46_009791 [Perkinsus olseni]
MFSIPTFGPSEKTKAALKLGARFSVEEQRKLATRRRKLYVAAAGAIVMLGFQYKYNEVIEVVGNPSGITSPSTLFYSRLVFGRTRSRITGSLMSRTLPVKMREPLFKLYAKATGADLTEIRYPLDAYHSFQEFFTRALKDGARPMEDVAPTTMVCPCDGEVVNLGVIDRGQTRVSQLDPTISGVKGGTYMLSGFLGVDPMRRLHPESKLMYAVIYLSPGDYHRFHSPTKFQLQQARHFPGDVLPVMKPFASAVDDLFTANERVVLSGTWAFGQCHYVPVAAYNVGGIKLAFENKLRTNQLRSVSVYTGGEIRTRLFDNAFQHGDPIGTFMLGSTIVMMFEAPQSMDWAVEVGDKVKMGHLLTQPLKKAAATKD